MSARRVTPSRVFMGTRRSMVMSAVCAAVNAAVARTTRHNIRLSMEFSGGGGRKPFYSTAMRQEFWFPVGLRFATIRARMGIRRRWIVSGAKAPLFSPAFCGTTEVVPCYKAAIFQHAVCGTGECMPCKMWRGSRRFCVWIVSGAKAPLFSPAFCGTTEVVPCYKAAIFQHAVCGTGECMTCYKATSCGGLAAICVWIPSGAKAPLFSPAFCGTTEVVPCYKASYGGARGDFAFGFPQGLKPHSFLAAFAARLKSCPVTKQVMAGLAGLCA